jgi:hypothetical protein
LRYPLKISTVFSEMLARMSLRFLSKVFEAAVIRGSVYWQPVEGRTVL